MQLNVIRGKPATGKTIRLRQIAKEAGQSEGQIIVGRNYNDADLALLVRHRVSRGAKVVCIDECSEAQIDLLQRLKGDVVIHAVVAN